MYTGMGFKKTHTRGVGQVQLFFTHRGDGGGASKHISRATRPLQGREPRHRLTQQIYPAPLTNTTHVGQTPTAIGMDEVLVRHELLVIDAVRERERGLSILGGFNIAQYLVTSRLPCVDG